MALSRRSGSRFEANIWPGFVDALTALLLILMFVLSIFMIVQFSLRETITGQSQELDDLTAKLSAISEVLSVERSRSATLESEVGTLRATLAEEQSESDRLNAALATLGRERDAALARIGQLETDLAAETATRQAAETARDEEASENALLTAALAAARTEIDAQTEAARLDAARREAMEALIADLESDKAAQEQEIAVLSADKSQALALIAALEEQKADLDAERDSEAAERQRLEQERLATLALLEALRGDKAALQSRSNDLSQQLATSESARAALAAAEAELEAQLERNEEANRALTSQVYDLDAERRELEALKAAALAELEDTQAALTAEEEARLLEAAAAQQLRERLAENADKLDATTLSLEKALAEAEERLTLLAAADAARTRLEAEMAARGETLAELEARLAEEQRRRAATEDTATQRQTAFDREAALRALAESELASARAQTLEEQQRVALLTAEVNELQKQIGALESTLAVSEQQDAADQIQISQLGERLNAALARRVAVEAEKAALEAENAALLAEQVDRLEQVRSIFLERVEAALSGREGIRRVGDRFVFQSEILFGPGSATLGPAGQAELTNLGAVVRDVARDLPEDVNWILRIDGHTDRIPLSGQGQFANNWELSQARALSVVTYLIDQEGVPPDRLAATGFGEYQPVDTGGSPAALARNRRIEFKFTER